jgi:hypothetical protein
MRSRSHLCAPPAAGVIGVWSGAPPLNSAAAALLLRPQLRMQIQSALIYFFEFFLDRRSR